MRTAAVVSCFLVILLAACGGRREQMVLQLEELERQNQADCLMTNSQLAEALVAYFDDYGTPNERVRAHYILGRTWADLGEAPRAIEAYLDAAECADTTSSDCDYAKLSRVYGQMGTIYYKQNLMDEFLNCLDNSESYAWKAADTIQALGASARKILAYNRLHHYDDVVVAFDTVFDSLLKFYGVKVASQYSILPVNALLKLGRLERAKELLDLMERESGYFNSDNDIEEGREGYYYYKGMYFLAINNADSAIWYFRKEQLSAKDLMNQNMSARGMALAFEQMRLYDSATVYSIRSYDLNDSVYTSMATEDVEQMTALYNYSRHQKEAFVQREAAAQEKRRNQVLTLTLLALITVLAYTIHSWHRKKKNADKELHDIMAKLSEAREQIAIMQDHDTENREALEAFLHEKIAEKEMQIKVLEETVRKNDRYYTLKKSDDNRLLNQYDIYKELTKKVYSGRLMTEDEWYDVVTMVKTLWPGFASFADSIREQVTEKEYRTCFLFRIHFRIKDVATLLGVDKSYISQISSNLMRTLFDAEGSGKELKKRIERIP